MGCKSQNPAPIWIKSLIDRHLLLQHSDSATEVAPVTVQAALATAGTSGTITCKPIDAQLNARAKNPIQCATAISDSSRDPGTLSTG